MPLVVVRRSLSSLRQERYQLRATTPIPPPRPSHVCDRLTDPLLHVLVDRVFLNPLKLLLQRPIRANVHLWIMQPDFSPGILLQAALVMPFSSTSAIPADQAHGHASFTYQRVDGDCSDGTREGVRRSECSRNEVHDANGGQCPQDAMQGMG
jgi:hypothetical protein